MKQLLFLLLFPCLALAQYPGNANQKITLGEQTTADGLVYRGVENDTALITPLSDTSAYIILDTVNNKFYNYNRATNVWSLAGGGVSVSSFSAGTTGLSPSEATTGAVTLGGTLAVANGGTGTGTEFTQGSVVFAGASGTYTQDASNLFWNNTEKRLGIGTASPTNPLSLVSSGGSFLIASSGQFTTKQDLDVTSSGGRWTAQSTRGTLGRIRIEQTTLNVDGGYMSFDTSPSGSTTPTERLRIFNNGDVHIGDYNYDSRFVIKHNATNRDAFSVNYSNANVPMFQVYQSTNDTEFNLRNNSTVSKFRLTTNGDSYLNGGNVGIGITTPSEALHVVGNGRFTAVGAGAFGDDLNITSDGTLTTETSDEKYKYNILPINYGLNTILQLKPVNFQWIKGEENDLGFIAQDVAEIIPEAVNTNWNSDLLMRYNSIIPILTKAIQEQQALIKALEQRILNLENK